MSNDPIANWGTLETPYSEDAEAAALGAIIVDGHRFMECTALVQAESFFILRHRYIWEALERLHARKEPIDYLTVCEQLKADKRLTEIGGPAYITQLINTTPTSVHAKVYAALVERFAIRRQMMAIADEIKALALDEEISVDDGLLEAKQKLDSIRPPTIRRRTPSLKDVMSGMYDQFEERVEKGVTTMGIPTGYNRLNELLGGWRKKRSHIVGGRPGMGKSQFMLDCGLKVAKQKKLDGAPYNVLMVSLEMTDDELGERLLSHETKLSTRQILSIEMARDEYHKARKSVIDAIARLSDVPLYLEDGITELSPARLRELCYDFRSDHGTLDLVIVDYLQLMSPDADMKKNRNRNQQEEISSISRALKLLPRELDVPFISGAQLSRESEGKSNSLRKRKVNFDPREPELKELRGSGSLEQDADVVLFPFLPSYYTNPNAREGEWKVIVAKQRGGPLGVMYGYANFNQMTFTEQSSTREMFK